MKHRKKAIASLLVLLTLGLLFVSVPQAKAQFVVSGIGALDEYGQGVSPNGVDILENSTGSWVYAQPFGGVPSPFNWSAGLFMQIRLESRLNSTLTGAVSLADGKNYFKHNITVTLGNGTVVFSLQNFTYRNAANVSGIFYYSYEVILNFIPVSGTIYVAAIFYEVYYS